MAEFQEVMKQAKRMCKQYKNTCEGCALYGEHDCLFQNDRTPEEKNLNFLADAEKIVMDWVENHPEPTYPTWNEWYKATFPNSNYHTIPCPSMFYKICETSNYHGEVECYECKNRPIPADIAEKLGVKPIGVKNDA